MLSTLVERQCQSLRFQQARAPRIHIDRYESEAPACLLVHGGGDGAFVWDLFAPILANRYTTIAVDLRGHGDSGWDPNRRYEMNGHLSDLINVIDRSRVDRLVLVGHSLGAHIAIRLYPTFATRIAASVLVDYAPELNSQGIEHARALMSESLRFYPTVDHYTEWLKSTRHLAALRTLERMASRSLRRVGDGFRPKLDPAILDAFPRTTPDEAHLLWDLLEKQNCPTLVVRGAGSAVLSQPVANRLAKVLPRGELATVNAAGHSVMLDNPAEFERIVIGFLDRVLTRPDPA